MRISIFALHMPDLTRVEKNLKITIAYTLKDTNGRVIEEIPPSHPVVYIHGLSDFVPQGLQNALQGLGVSNRAVVSLSFDEAYGPYQKDLVMEVPKEELQDVGQLWVGMEIEMVQDEPSMEDWKAPDDPADLFRDEEMDEPSLFVIREIREKTVVLDGNHPLAGLDLCFEVTVVAIEHPSIHELEQGYPDFGSGEDPEQDSGWGGQDFGEGRHWR